MSLAIKDVSDTAYWVAHHRALETARTDALFRDPFAERLAGERGRRMSEEVPTSRIVAWTVAIRTLIIDEFITQALASGIDTVLSLGSGLDARPYRMQLPQSLRWIEADYPRVIEYKEAQLAQEQPRCKLESVKIDLADATARRALFDRVDDTPGQILVLTEGLVPYLTGEAVGVLAAELHSMRHVRFWIVDYFSQQALRYQQSGAVQRTMRNAPFQFHPQDWFGFFKASGWEVDRVRYIPEEGHKLGRPMPLPLLARLIIKFTWRWASQARRDLYFKSAGYAMLRKAG